MKKLALAATIALLAVTSASADGYGTRRHHHWRGPAYSRAGISHNVITPYYVGYYPYRYSYFRPDPVPSGYAFRPRVFQDGCWFAYEGAIWWGC